MTKEIPVDPVSLPYRSPRHYTAMEALMWCAPGQEPETSLMEYVELREALMDAFELLSEKDQWLLNELISARTSLRDMGIPKTSVARHRDAALGKWRDLVKEHPLVIDHLFGKEAMTVPASHLLANRTVFLSGPMRGYPNFNFDVFRETRQRLRADGITVVCPAERDEQNGFNPVGLNGTETELQAAGFDIYHALADSVHDILNNVDVVVVLPGWQKSVGTRIEMAVALKYNKPVYTLADNGELHARVRREVSGGTGVWVVTPL
jgi:hypothetical protein